MRVLTIVLVFVLNIFICSGALTMLNLSMRVIGGGDAKIGVAPYHVSIQQKGKYICGGSIIHKSFILTAAHCVKRPYTVNFTILTGTNDLGNGGKIYESENIFVHPEYNMFNGANDIALIKLKENIEFNNLTQSIKPDWTPVNEGIMLTLTGWGDTSPNYRPRKLQILDVKVISNEECIKILKTLGVKVNKENLCTLNRIGQGACNGDSGGPLVYNGKQVALVSGGIPCAKGYPDVQTRISCHYDFITTTIKENS